MFPQTFSKDYMGDGVYVEVQHGSLVITTEDGTGAQNTIYVEDQVWAALVRYVGRATTEGGAS
jgi:formylmethanofuran dehydrogenase subunit D